MGRPAASKTNRRCPAGRSLAPPRLRATARERRETLLPDSAAAVALEQSGRRTCRRSVAAPSWPLRALSRGCRLPFALVWVPPRSNGARLLRFDNPFHPSRHNPGRCRDRARRSGSSSNSTSGCWQRLGKRDAGLRADDNFPPGRSSSSTNASSSASARDAAVDVADAHTNCRNTERFCRGQPHRHVDVRLSKSHAMQHAVALPRASPREHRHAAARQSG